MKSLSGYPFEFQFTPPEKITDRSFLLGIEDGTPIYWDSWNARIIRPKETFDPDPHSRTPKQDGFQTKYPEYTAHDYSRRDGNTIAEYIQNSKQNHDWEFTPLGEFLYLIASSNGQSVLSREEIEVYALRKYTLASRETVAEHLGISSDAVTDHYQNAKTRIEATNHLEENIPKPDS